ncbi:hypothetical protein [Neobacillus sp. FSL H8-0543]
MKESKLLLSEFTNEEGFELNNYLTQLFDIVRGQKDQGDVFLIE